MKKGESLFSYLRKLAITNFYILDSHRQKATSCLFSLSKRRRRDDAGACPCHVARLAPASGWLARRRVACSVYTHVHTCAQHAQHVAHLCVCYSFDYGQKTRTHVLRILRSQMAENFTTAQGKLSRTFLQISLKSFA